MPAHRGKKRKTPRRRKTFSVTNAIFSLGFASIITQGIFRNNILSFFLEGSGFPGTVSGGGISLKEISSYLLHLLPRPGGASRGHDVRAGYSPGPRGSWEALSGPLGYRVVHFWLNRADRQTSRPRLGSAVWALALRRGGVA